MQTHTAEIAKRQRDLYHNIMDVNPNSTTEVNFVAFRDSASATLYLYGSEFKGALPEHMHTGNNAHAHTLSGSISSASASHTHSLSGSTNNSNATHSHPASYSGYSTPSHNHSASTTSNGRHFHDFEYYGIQSGLYLFHYPEGGDGHHLAAHGNQNQVATGSVAQNQSEHSHTISVGGNSGGSHRHSVTVNSGNATHSHSLSGSTGSHNVSHSHGHSLSIASAGSGLNSTGITASTLPADVSVYVDNVLAAGPFTGAFSTGALDLSTFTYDAGEHVLEIREQGGSGGRISYNLFVE